MNNPLNELSAVYNQSIAEGCECDKKDKKADMMPQGRTPMGGDGAKPGKDKNYVKPMDEGYDKPDEKLKTGRKMFTINQKERDDARERLLAKAKAKREAMKEGHCDVEGVECSPTEKKKDAKKMKKESSIYSNWREGWEFLGEYAGGPSTYAGKDSEKNLQNPKAKTSSKSQDKIVEKEIKNKIKINPPQGVTEAFAELGGEIIEMYEIDEKIDLKKADMGEVIKDFRKSDAPQFEGKSEEKKRQMAIAAKLDAEDSMKEETEEEKKKRELMARTKEHDAKREGKFAEGRALAGVISTIRSKNGMDKISAKGKDKLQDKKDKSMCEAAPLAIVPVLAKAGAIADKAAAAGAKGAATAGKVGAKVGSVASKAAKVTGKVGSKVGKSVSKVTPSKPSSSDGSGSDLGGNVKNMAGKVAKKVVSTGVNMVKDPLKQSFNTLTTNEELSIDDQMRISQKYNRMSPEEKKAANKKAVGTIKKVARQKDTRTDAQKMTDATGPRPGSRYRGD